MSGATRRWDAALLAALGLALAGCGPTTYAFHGEGLAVGADAELELHHLQQNTHDVRLVARHLPTPARIAPAATVYAVWFFTRSGEATLGGFVDYDEATREGRARATTPAAAFELRITAEPGRDVVAPSEHVVLRHPIES